MSPEKQLKLKEQLAKIADLKTRVELLLSEEPTPPAPPTGTQIVAKDGSVYSVAGEVAEGSEIMVIGTDGESPAPDGDIETEDGKIISVASGKITAIGESPLPADPPADEAFAALRAEFAALQTTLGAIQVELTAIKTTRAAENAAVSAQLSALTETTILLSELPNGGEPNPKPKFTASGGGPLGRSMAAN